MTALREFLVAPLRLRVWISLAVVLAVALPLILSSGSSPAIRADDLAIAIALVAGSVVNVEVGRLFEGGRVAQQRPHKALSAWPMAATILLPSYYLLPIVALVYAHARWRGVRVTLWKWIASACFLICAGAVAGAAVATGDGGMPPTLSSGLPGLLIVLGAIVAFLLVECAMLALTALLNTPQDDVWLRQTLADPSFYVMEAGVVTLGAMTGLVASGAGWFVLLLIPAYGFLQQSVLHRPLQEQATRDPKTGLLHFTAWQRLAGDQVMRHSAHRRPWAVLFIDIDNFRFYNQRQGHLGGDRALAVVAEIITANVREHDIVARFGGEEFCVLLPGTTPEAATLIAERLRAAVSEGSSVLPEQITVSVGVAAVGSNGPPTDLGEMLALADQALYQAKLDGRDLVRVRRPPSDASAPKDPADPGDRDRRRA